MIFKGILWGMVLSVALVDAVAIIILLFAGAAIDNILIYVLFFCVILMAFLASLKDRTDRDNIDKMFKEN